VGALRRVALAGICLLLLAPLWLMVVHSLTPALAFLRTPPQLIPATWTLENYAQVLRLPHIDRWLQNTILATALIVTIGVLVNGSAGYVFAYAKGRVWRWIFWVFLAPLFVTRFTLLISQFVIVAKLRLDGMPAVVLFSAFWPAGIFLFRNYFTTVPSSLLESARIDGASEWTIFTRVVLPLCKPIVGAAMVLLGLGALGDYVWQMLNMQGAETQTMLVGLINSTLDVRVVDRIGYDLAVGTVLFIPMMLLFLASSRYFIGGLMMGASKE
jgi:multiple sugar transport system permease protein